MSDESTDTIPLRQYWSRRRLVTICRRHRGVRRHGRQVRGRAIVAFSGAPIYFDDHAVKATMALKRLVGRRERWKAEASLSASLRQMWADWEKEG